MHSHLLPLMFPGLLNLSLISLMFAWIILAWHMPLGPLTASETAPGRWSHFWQVSERLAEKLRSLRRTSEHTFYSWISSFCILYERPLHGVMFWILIEAESEESSLFIYSCTGRAGRQGQAPCRWTRSWAWLVLQILGCIGCFAGAHASRCKQVQAPVRTLCCTCTCVQNTPRKVYPFSSGGLCNRHYLFENVWGCF